jgi:hypothetical protein
VGRACDRPIHRGLRGIPTGVAPRGFTVAELSEGTSARSSRCVRPLAKSGLDLAIEGRGPGLRVEEANPPDDRL